MLTAIIAVGLIQVVLAVVIWKKIEALYEKISGSPWRT